MDYLPLISLIVSILTGPVVIAAVVAMHKSSTSDLIEKALEKERAITEKAIAAERDRNGEVYALKHEVSEMKGHVMQLVANTNALDTKLDRMQELLLSLQRAR